MSKPVVSVVVCCYNSVERLPATLSALLGQKASIRWELIVVDNNSTDGTELWVRNYLKGKSIDYRVETEQKPGLAHARKKGLEAAQGEYVVFCDDDNHLSQHYVETVTEIFKKFPDVGVIGGCGEALPEGKLPEWLAEFAPSYALGHQASNTGFVEYSKRWFGVYGAGMAIRKRVLEQMQEIGFMSRLKGREGNALSSGEDTELCMMAWLLGWRIYYDERLTFKHFIPSNRLKKDYLERVYEGFSRARPYLESYRLAYFYFYERGRFKKEFLEMLNPLSHIKIIRSFKKWIRKISPDEQYAEYMRVRYELLCHKNILKGLPTMLLILGGMITSIKRARKIGLIKVME